MMCYLMAFIHLTQLEHVIKEVLQQSSQSNFIGNTENLSHWNVFGNYTFRMIGKIWDPWVKQDINAE